jgi:hypothetical protein
MLLVSGGRVLSSIINLTREFFAVAAVFKAFFINAAVIHGANI